MLRVSHNDVRLDSAREDWSRGEDRLRRLRLDPTRIGVLDEVVVALQRALRRELGQTYTLVELNARYDGAEAWGRDVAQLCAPGVAWAHDQSIVDAVFAGAARGASDWSPW